MSQPKSRVGTNKYMAPEVTQASRGLPYDGTKADIWSCGVMLYTMLVGAYPFSEDEPRALTRQIMGCVWGVTVSSSHDGPALPPSHSPSHLYPCRPATSAPAHTHARPPSPPCSPCCTPERETLPHHAPLTTCPAPRPR